MDLLFHSSRERYRGCMLGLDKKKTLRDFEEQIHMMFGRDVNMVRMTKLVKQDLVGLLEFITMTKMDMVDSIKKTWSSIIE